MRHFLLSTAIRNLPVAFVGVVHLPQGPVAVKVIHDDNGNPVRIDASEFDPQHHKEFVGNETHHADGTPKIAGQPQSETGSQPAGTTQTNNDDEMSLEDLKERIKSAAFGVAEMKFGRKKPAFYVLDTNIVGDDKRVDDIEGIDTNGYPDNASAWAAVTAVQTKANG